MENKSNKSDFSPQMQDLSSILTHERLYGTNCTEQALNVENRIRGHRHCDYIFEKTNAPTNKTSEEYDTWEDGNYMVKYWLLNAMTKDVRLLFICLPTTKKIWDSVKATCSINQDASKAYQLYCDVLSIKHNEGSIVSYFAKLQ